MNKSMLLIVFLGLLFVSTAVAQQPGDTLWTRTFGGEDYDYAYSVQQTDDGGYILAGSTRSFGAGSYDFYLVKTDSLGYTLWIRTHGGSDGENAYSVKQTNDGGYIITGDTESFGAGQDDFYLVKIDSFGDTLWTRTYGGIEGDHAYSVQQTDDSGYIIAGATNSFGAGQDDFYLVKTDSIGDTLWTWTYGGSSNDYATSVQQTGDGGYILAGYTASFGVGGKDFYLVKTDSLGNALWTRTYGGDGHEWAESVQQTGDGGYIIAGFTETFGAGDKDFYLVKADSLGDSLWTRAFGGDDYDRAYSIQQTDDGGYIVTGRTESFGAGGIDCYLVRTDSLGDTLWTRTYGGQANDYASSVQQTDDGGYILGGRTASSGAGSYDFYLVKIAREELLGCDYVPGDVNGDGNVMGNDVTYGVRYFKGLGSPPPDSCQLPDESWLYSAGDANGNCQFTGSDITFLVAYFKGYNPEILWCPETPPSSPLLGHLRR